MVGTGSRRWYLRRSLIAPAAAFFAAVAGGAAWRGSMEPPMDPSDGLIPVGRPAEYAVGEARHWPDGRFYVVRVPEGFLALVDRCPHQGCPIPAPRDGVFECRCHFSRFTLSGVRLVGPADRPMDLLPISLNDGGLVVQAGESAAQRRSKYDPSQAFRP